MARLPRLSVAHQPHHLVQYGHEHLPLFREEADYRFFLDCLRQAAHALDLRVHGFCLLPDRFHVVLTPPDAQTLSRGMQWLGRNYVPYYNRCTTRQGGLWRDRFRANVFEAATYLLPHLLLLDSLPVRHNEAPSAEAWPWSSARHHLGSEGCAWLSDHPVYWQLGNTPFQREAAYRAQLHAGLPAEQAERLLAAAHKGWLLGSPAFAAEVAALAGRRVLPGRRGRPVRSGATGAEV